MWYTICFSQIDGTGKRRWQSDRTAEMEFEGMQKILREYIPHQKGAVGLRTGRMIALVVALMCLVLIPARPLAARQGKEARRVGGTVESKTEKRVRVIEPKHGAVRDEAQIKKNVPRGNKPKPRTRREVKREESARPPARQRRELPIIEGHRRQGPASRAPERVMRDRLRENPTPGGRMGADAELKVKDTLDRFERDWVNGNSRALTDLLSRRSRVKITIESKDIDDSFSSGQAQYVLKEYLSSADRRDLSFSRFRVSSSDGVSAYGVGKMRMRDKSTGRMIDHTVYVSLAREGEDWTVREIKLTK